MELVACLMKNARDIKQTLEEDYFETTTTRTPRQKKRQQAERSTMDVIRELDSEASILRRRKVSRVSLISKPSLPSKRFDRPAELHCLTKLPNTTNSPACEMYKVI